MKVLQINSFFSSGGPPRIVKGIHDTLISEGHQSVLAASREKPIPGMEIIPIGNSFDQYRNALMARIFDNEGFAAKKATRKLIEDIKRCNPDIIHLHNLHGYYINVEILFNYLSACGKPVVWTLHDCWAFTGHCSYFDMANCDKWTSECSSCPQKKAYPKSMILDKSRENFGRKKVAFTSVGCLHIITPSNWLADLARKSFFYETAIQCIHNGIDTSVFSPKESQLREQYNLENKRLILGVAAVWDQRKGYDDFLALAKIIDPTDQIVMIGLSEKQISELPSNILGFQRTNELEELLQWYTTADVFVNTTMEEVFGLVNTEALSCGTPVITYQTGGCPEAVNEKCGIILDKRTPDAIYQALATFDKKHITADDCIARAKEFEQVAMYGQYLELYKQLL